MSIHIQRSVLLPYPVRALFNLVNDMRCYPRFLPRCSASQVLEESEGLTRAELAVAKGSFSQRFATCNVLVPGTSIEMDLESGLSTELRGVRQFKALSERTCKITFDLTLDCAGPLIKVTLGSLLAQAANTMVNAFCQRARQLYS